MRLKIERDGDGYERKLKNQKQWPRVYGQQQQFHFVKNVISNRRRRRKKKRIFCGLVVVVWNEIRRSNVWNFYLIIINVDVDDDPYIS